MVTQTDIILTGDNTFDIVQLKNAIAKLTTELSLEDKTQTVVKESSTIIPDALNVSAINADTGKVIDFTAATIKLIDGSGSIVFGFDANDKRMEIGGNVAIIGNLTVAGNVNLISGGDYKKNGDVVV